MWSIKKWGNVMKKTDKQVIVQPKRIITSAKFGVSILPAYQYVATLSNGRYLVDANSIVRLMVDKKDVKVIPAVDKSPNEQELLEEAKDDATEAILEKAKEEADSYVSLFSSDDILYLRDEMNTAWRAVESVEAAKNIRAVQSALARYIGCNEAKKVIKI